MSEHTFFFGGYDHLSALGGWGANSDRCYYPLCTIVVKCCFVIGFPERLEYWCVCVAQEVLLLLEVDMSWFC